MILLTGGTGMVGGEIVQLLSQDGTPARALVRNPQKAKNLPGITWVSGDLAKPETLPAAFEGAKTLFLVSSIGEDTVALQHNAIEAARQAGVTHIVKLSAFGATDHSKAPICLWHYQIEQEMQESGMDWTILRPHHFMQNLLTQTEYIINDGVVYSASGDGKIPYIDARDIAAVAAVTLTKPGHRGKTYVITGSEALSYRQATEIISNTIGKPLRFVDETPDAARARREREGYPPAIIESVLAIGAYQRAGGKTVTITNVVSDLTGRPPRTFPEFARPCSVGQSERALFIMLEPSTKTRPISVEQRPPFEQIALLLQGGGALGSYQAGAYEALTEANLHPDWVAGISIGAVNAALIAGNVPEKRVEKLREFWEAVSTSPLGVPYLMSIEITNELTRRLVNQSRSLGTLLYGAPNFFTPRTFPPWMWRAESAGSVSYYDVAPLKNTLERLVDFDCINSNRMRFSVGAVNVGTGNFIYFDSTTHHITPAHIMASGALPPGFPPIEIEGDYYWDGGLVSNTPLQWVLDSRPRKDTLAFQVDLWSADGDLPLNLQEAEVRQKEILYSSRTRAATNQFKKGQTLRRAFREVLEHLPDNLQTMPQVELLARESDENVYNIVHLIYHAKSYEGASKDYEFSRRTMEEHWQAGYGDVVRNLQHPEVLQRPNNPEGVQTFDFCKKRLD